MIGLFDSGFGGLTILRAIASLPDRLDLIYLGDNARAPFGSRSGTEIVDFTREGVDRLVELGCRLVIIACNTASAVALANLQKNWLPSRSGPKFNVLGIIVPTIERTTGLLWREKEPKLGSRDSHDVAVFATSRTVETNIYPIEIAKRRPDITVYQEACPTLASAIEAGTDQPELRKIVEAHVTALVSRMGHLPRHVILGCTHYSLLADFFAQALGPKVSIIDQTDAVSASLLSYIRRHSEYGIGPGHGDIQFFTSGFKPEALKNAEIFWGSPLSFTRLEF